MGERNLNLFFIGYTPHRRRTAALWKRRESKKDAKHTRAHEDIKAQRSDTIKYTKVFCELRRERARAAAQRVHTAHNAPCRTFGNKNIYPLSWRVTGINAFYLFQGKSQPQLQGIYIHSELETKIFPSRAFVWSKNKSKVSSSHISNKQSCFWLLFVCGEWNVGHWDVSKDQFSSRIFFYH